MDEIQTFAAGDTPTGGLTNQVLTKNSATDYDYSWKTPAQPSSSVVAETSFGASSAVGVSTNYARQDHTHGTPAAPTTLTPGSVNAQVNFSLASQDGVATSYSRSDHAHGTPAHPLPSGGAATYILTKNSATSYDYSWQAPPAGGGGSGSVATDTIWDAKGDLAIGSANDAAVRIPIGPDGTVLVADSNQTLGAKWGTSTPPAFTVVTSSITLQPNFTYPLDATGSSFTVTLPTAPAQNTRVVLDLLAVTAPNTVTVNCGGSDKFNSTTGPTSKTMVNLGDVLYLQYTNNIWLVISDAPSNKPLSYFGAATSQVSMGSQKIINLANGTAATDAINKSQLDALPTLTAGTDIDVSTTTGVTTVSVLPASSQKWGHADWVLTTTDDAAAIPSNITQQADPGLTGNLSVVANATYYFEAVIYYTALTTAEIKSSWRGPTGATWILRSFGPDTPWAVGATTQTMRILVHDQANFTIAFGGMDATISSFDTRGFIKTAGTAGTIDFWYAQNVSQTTATIRKAGSFSRIMRVA